MRRTNKKNKISKIITNHIYENLKSYIIVTIILLIGIVLGVIYINNINQDLANEIKEYINNFVNTLKDNYTIDKVELMKNTIISNSILVVTMWFVGSTVIGIPIVLGIIAYRGFCIGYTISAALITLGSPGGIIFSISSMLLQNLLFIPAILALGVSGIKLYKSIMKDKRRENIKIEIIRHTLFSIFMLIILLVASVIETYLSTELIIMTINFI